MIKWLLWCCYCRASTRKSM